MHETALPHGASTGCVARGSHRSCRRPHCVIVQKAVRRAHAQPPPPEHARAAPDAPCAACAPQRVAVAEPAARPGWPSPRTPRHHDDSVRRRRARRSCSCARAARVRRFLRAAAARRAARAGGRGRGSRARAERSTTCSGRRCATGVAAPADSAAGRARRRAARQPQHGTAWPASATLAAAAAASGGGDASCRIAAATAAATAVVVAAATSCTTAAA
jgi:hypothetical protein